MHIAINLASGSSAAVPFDNGEARNYMVLAWGTFTNAALEISPDGGTTWEQVVQFSGSNNFTTQFLAPEAGYQLRVTLTSGSDISVDVN